VSRLAWGYIIYELLGIACLIGYSLWYRGQHIHEIAGNSFIDAITGLIPLVIVLFMVYPAFMVFHDP
jgi:sorbitol-specific phosphotransferase system component IIC